MFIVNLLLINTILPVHYIFDYSVIAILLVTIFSLMWQLDRRRREQQTSLSYDAFTKLPNRYYFHTLLHQRFTRGNIDWLAVVYIDIDRFSLVNHLYSYEYGNTLLKQFVQKFQPYLSKNVELFRIDGDEFALVLWQREQLVILEQLTEQLQIQIPLNDRNIFTTTCSMGVSFYPEHGKTSEELLRIAKIALLTAQAQGGSTVHFYEEESGQEKLKLLEMEFSLYNALQNNEFSLYYQPQFHLQTKQFSGMEALVRWNSPIYGNVPPLDFIPLAEQCGFIHDLGYWIIEEACRQLDEWRQNGRDAISVSINLSPLQLTDSRFYERIVQLLATYDINPAHISFEITESMAVSDLQATNALLQKFEQLGVKIALDDFGTGYSSLSMLNDLRCHHLKIDRSFIRNFGSGSDSLTIIDAVIRIAHHYGMIVIAEGIETEEQLQLLRSIECDVAQGYFISRPVTADEVFQKMEQWLQK